VAELERAQGDRVARQVRAQSTVGRVHVPFQDVHLKCRGAAARRRSPARDPGTDDQNPITIHLVVTPPMLDRSVIVVATPWINAAEPWSRVDPIV
jgi:hypothetical protein